MFHTLLYMLVCPHLFLQANIETKYKIKIIKPTTI